LFDHPVPFVVSVNTQEADACEWRLQMKSVIVVAESVNVDRITRTYQRMNVPQARMPSYTYHLVEFWDEPGSKSVDCNSEPNDSDINHPLLPVLILVVRIPQGNNRQNHRRDEIGY